MINLKINPEDIHVKLEIKEYIGCENSGNIPIYEGEYQVIPKANEQTLETKGRKMRENVTVNKIPMYEFSNNFGTTVVIGGVL